MKKTGGVLHGEWETENLENGEMRRRCPAIVWGAVTADVESREVEKKSGTQRHLQFRIRLKRKEYVRCTLYSTSPFYWVANRLKQGDFVFVAGKITAWSYTNSEGENKISIDCYPQFLLTDQVISRMADVELEPDPLLSDDGEPDEEGNFSWNPLV